MQENGLIFLSIPDSGTCRLQLSFGGLPYFAIPNQLFLGTDVRTRLKRVAQDYWYPQQNSPLPVQPSWVLNTCADADDFAQALQALDDTYPSRTPIFNHPRAVMASRRDVVGNYLKSIPGLDVPKCRRFRADGPLSFCECFEQGEFRYPVTVKQSTARNGLGRLWITNRQSLESALAVGGGGGRWHVMIQSGPDEANIRSSVQMVFVGSAGTAFVSPNQTGREAANPRALPSKEFLQRILVAVNKRLPLDFWTLHVSVLSPDRLLLQDVSPGLPIPTEADQLAVAREQALAINARLEPQVVELLSAPGRWRGDARALPRVANFISS